MELASQPHASVGNEELFFPSSKVTEHCDLQQHIKILSKRHHCFAIVFLKSKISCIDMFKTEQKFTMLDLHDTATTIEKLMQMVSPVTHCESRTAGL